MKGLISESGDIINGSGRRKGALRYVQTRKFQTRLGIRVVWSKISTFAFAFNEQNIVLDKSSDHDQTVGIRR